MRGHINQTMGYREWAWLLSLGAIWGSSFYFNAIALQYLPVLTIVFVRLGLAAVCLWAMVFGLRLATPLNLKTWGALLLLGTLNNAIPFLLIVWGQTMITASLASIINATTPFFTLITAHYLTHDEPMRRNRFVGVMIGFSGVAIMIGLTALSGLWDNIIGQLAILGATFSYGFASVWGRHLSHLPVLVIAAGQTTCSSLLLLPMALFFDQPWLLPIPDIKGIGAIIGLALPCTALAYYLFFSILRAAGAANVSLVTFLVPASAILLGSILLGDVLETRHVIGMITIASGLLLIDGRLFKVFQPKQ